MPERAAEQILRTTFGFEGFRPGQAEIVAEILDGRDVLAVMPTGSGKSLCYQLPALLRDGLTIVVSPLIALMRNQVAQLRGYGVAAAALNSANDAAENWAISDRITRGDLRLLYIAPERLVKAETIELLKRAKIALLAVDEAHCISQWGHDFRPEYAALGAVQAELGNVQTVAFTATATPPRARILWISFSAAGRQCSCTASIGRICGWRCKPSPAEGSRSPTSSVSIAGKAASSIAPRGGRPRSLRMSCAAAASRRCAYHAGMEPWSARATRTFSCRRTASSWSRPWRSAWASTSRMSASWFMPTCRPISRAIIRRSAAPAETGFRPTR